MTKIPQGDEVLTVQLTVKELIALTGVRFNEDRKVKVSAHKKLNSVLEQTLSGEQSSSGTLYY